MQEKENSTKSTLLIIALIIIIILLGVIIYMLVNNKKANNDINSQSKTTTTEKINNTDDIKKTIEKFLEIDCALHTDSILEYLNIGYDESKGKYDESTEMVITNIKYDDFKNAMLNYMTEEYFKKETSNYIKDSDGYVRKSQGGGECYISKINNITKTGNLSYSVNITETSDVDDSINNNTTQKFTFKEYNNKLVIDTYSGRE